MKDGVYTEHFQLEIGEYNGIEYWTDPIQAGWHRPINVLLCMKPGIKPDLYPPSGLVGEVTPTGIFVNSRATTVLWLIHFDLICIHFVAHFLLIECNSMQVCFGSLHDVQPTYPKMSCICTTCVSRVTNLVGLKTHPLQQK